MVAGTGLVRLQRQPEQVDRVGHVRGRPPVRSLAHVGRDTRPSREGDHLRDEPLLVSVVDLGQAHHGHVRASLRELTPGQLRGHPGVRVLRVEVVLGCGLPRDGRPHRGPRRDEQGTVGALEDRAQRLDGTSILPAVRDEVREVVVEGGVDHAIAASRAAAQAVEILDVAPVCLGASCRERLRPRIRARQSEHLMARVDEFRHDLRADEAGGTGEKNTHRLCPALHGRPICAHLDQGKSRDLIPLKTLTGSAWPSRRRARWGRPVP